MKYSRGRGTKAPSNAWRFPSACSQPVVYLEHYRGSGFLSDEGDVADYRELAKVLGKKALGEEASRELLVEASG
ncbi:Scr1 family TA system antitoxin-like transcriptional regulator [Amycolatopsis sp. NPDC058986]|uniref:Scr1 family TA system antitoxin-like transcriptional regulator n=1 Tax=unclassified Amycolatopsis TaxID=2618356 RepID=UPI00366E2160